MRLPYVRRAAPEVIATATSQRWEHAEVLRVLLAEEAPAATRRRSGHADALRPASREDVRRLGTERSVIPAATQQALRTLEWIDRARLGVCGPSGSGKSHFIEAWGTSRSTGQNRRLAHPRDLAQLFRRHRADDSVNKAIGN